MTGQSVASVLSHMSGAEYQGWRSYRRLHPPEGTEVLLATVLVAMYRYMSGDKGQALKTVDFVPWLAPLLNSPEQISMDLEAERKERDDQRKAVALSWARAQKER